jgi:hypothetical protein
MPPLLQKGGEILIYNNFLLLPEEEYSRLAGREVVFFLFIP